MTEAVLVWNGLVSEVPALRATELLPATPDEEIPVDDEYDAPDPDDPKGGGWDEDQGT